MDPADSVEAGADVDYARALASGAIVNPNTVIVECGTSGAYQIVPVG